MGLKIEIKERGNGKASSRHIVTPKGMRELILDVFNGAGLTGSYLFTDGHQVRTSGMKQGIEYVTAVLDPRTDHSFKFFAQPRGGDTAREFIVYCQGGAPSSEDAVEAITNYIQSLKSEDVEVAGEPVSVVAPPAREKKAHTPPKKEMSGDIAEVRHLLAEAEAELAKVSAELEAEQATLTAADKAVNVKQRLLVEVQHGLKSVTAEITPLEAELQELEAEIVRLQRRQEALQGQLREINGRREVVLRAVRDRERDLETAVSATKIPRRKIELLSPKRARLEQDAADYREMLEAEQDALLETRVEIVTEGLDAAGIEALIARLQAAKAQKAGQ